MARRSPIHRRKHRSREPKYRDQHLQAASEETRLVTICSFNEMSHEAPRAGPAQPQSGVFKQHRARYCLAIVDLISINPLAITIAWMPT